MKCIAKLTFLSTQVAVLTEIPIKLEISQLCKWEIFYTLVFISGRNCVYHFVLVHDFSREVQFNVSVLLGQENPQPFLVPGEEGGETKAFTRGW